MILGSGLGALAEEVRDPIVLRNQQHLASSVPRLVHRRPTCVRGRPFTKSNSRADVRARIPRPTMQMAIQDEGVVGVNLMSHLSMACHPRDFPSHSCSRKYPSRPVNWRAAWAIGCHGGFQHAGVEIPSKAGAFKRICAPWRDWPGNGGHWGGGTGNRFVQSPQRQMHGDQSENWRNGLKPHSAKPSLEQ